MDFPIKKKGGSVHSYVKLPEGIFQYLPVPARIPELALRASRRSSSDLKDWSKASAKPRNQGLFQGETPRWPLRWSLRLVILNTLVDYIYIYIYVCMYIIYICIHIYMYTYIYIIYIHNRLFNIYNRFWDLSNRFRTPNFIRQDPPIWYTTPSSK